MNENIVKRNELLAQKVIKGLESRNMSGYYAADKEEALKIALSLIPEGSSIGMGGAMSVHEIGLSDALKNGKLSKEALSSIPSLEPHAAWAEEWISAHGITNSDISQISDEELYQMIRDEVGIVFSHVLEDAGVYKCTSEGRTSLGRFINTLI